MSEDRQRAQKALANAGVASRRVCEEMIEDGRVLINGVVATLGDKVDTSVDELRLDGAVVSIDPTRRTCLLYTSPSPRDQRGSRMPSSA